MVQEQNSGERLSRFLAHAGIASRRHAEELIAAGRVQVNGVTVTTQGTRINPDTDIVLVDSKPVRTTTKHVYLLLHKPIGYVSTAHDPQGRPYGARPASCRITHFACISRRAPGYRYQLVCSC